MSPSKNNSEPTLRERALQTNKTNPSQLGDPVSLKAETSSTSPTSDDRGASSSKSNSSSQATKENVKKVAPAPTEGDQDGGDGKKTLRQRAMDKLEENPSQLGDPVSLKAETADSEPTDDDRGAGGSKGRKSKL
ncbi:hypothetical protein BKA64DRAFT_769542 [Cadophora sp. MPI-SDFR-AT-0126]|nr:hypothetical protein BKA64DRAFT_769542 [Leotiomycetes sp. MPI-SDFR-AT-0126]